MNKKTVVTKLPAGEIVEISNLADGTLEVVQSVAEIKELVSLNQVEDNPFVLIEAESLSLEDKFMQYKPKTEGESRTKWLITEAIKRRVKNFYRPKYDPSFDEYGNICFVAGRKPAVGLTYVEWISLVYRYNRECKSRFGTRFEYGAFLGVLMKKLVEEGRSVEWTWNAVCNNSKELGNFYDLRYCENDFELTGPRCVCGFFDITTTYKILQVTTSYKGKEMFPPEWTMEYWVAGGRGKESGHSIANIFNANINFKEISKSGVAWLVLERCPT